MMIREFSTVYSSPVKYFLLLFDHYICLSHLIKEIHFWRNFTLEMDSSTKYHNKYKSFIFDYASLVVLILKWILKLNFLNKEVKVIFKTTMHLKYLLRRHIFIITYVRWVQGDIISILSKTIPIKQKELKDTVI